MRTDKTTHEPVKMEGMVKKNLKNQQTNKNLGW